MLLTEKERERRRQQRFKQEVHEQELRRYANPERDPELAKVWVVYQWVPSDADEGEWLLTGFRRKRSLRKHQTMARFFSKIRRKLNIDKKSFVLLRDLDEASRRLKEYDQSWRTRPPQFHQRKSKTIARAPAKKKQVKKKPRRVTTRALMFNKKTKYVALGRSEWSREPGYLYLGPLASTAKRQAQFEARRIFTVYTDLLVLEVGELSEPLRASMARNKRVRAGVTRIAWPEVPPTFDEAWRKFATRLIRKELTTTTLDDPRMIDVELALHSEWEAQGHPWLTLSWFRKQILPWRPQCDVPKKRKPKRKRVTAVSRKASGPSLKKMIRRLIAKLRKPRSSHSPKRGDSRSAIGTRRVVRASLSWLGGKPSKRSRTIRVSLRRKDVLTVRASARRK